MPKIFKIGESSRAKSGDNVHTLVMSDLIAAVIKSVAPSCERDPIHLIGAIQPFGALLALDNNLRVTHVSANAAIIWGTEPHDILGRTLDDFFVPKVPHETLGSWLALNDGQSRNCGVKIQHGGILTDWNLCWHRQNGRHVLEFEPHDQVETQQTLSAFNSAEEAMFVLHAARDLNSLMQELTNQVRAMLGYDRVMVYRFDKDWNGAVMAESKGSHVRSFYGQRFPSTDIPAPARSAFLRKRLRIIPDVAMTYIPIIDKNDKMSPALDLSLSTLRAPAKVHMQYLRNMGVKASLTISLVKDDVLWGMVACHHLSPRIMTKGQRQAVELLCSAASGLVSTKEHAAGKIKRRRNQELLQAIETRLAVNDDMAANLTLVMPHISSLFDSAVSSVAIFVDGTWHTQGPVADASVLSAFAAWLAKHRRDAEIFCTDSLRGAYTRAEALKHFMAGVLAITFPNVDDMCLLIMRPEVLYEVTWAGSPLKAVEPAQDSNASLSPRSSFEKFKQIVGGKSVPFLALEIDVARRLRKIIIERDLKRQVEREKQQRLLLQQQERRSAFLASISHTLSTSRADGELVKELCRHVTQTLCDDIIVYRRDDSGYARVAAAKSGSDWDCALSSDELNETQQSVFADAVDAAYVHDRPQKIENVDAWLGAFADASPCAYQTWLAKNFQAASLLLLPVRVRHGEPLVLKLMRKPDSPTFTDNDVQTAMEMGERFSNALDNAALFAQTERAVAARDQVLSVVSHDLRNPLAAILLILDSMRRKLKAAQKEEALAGIAHASAPWKATSLDRIQSACQRMNSLIQDLLNLAKIDAGHFSVDLKPVDGKDLLSESASILEPIAQNKKLSLTQTIRASSTGFFGDWERLLQVVSNLAGNAIKFTPADGEINLGLINDEQGLKFWVKDTGCGISQDMLPHIFDRYWQAPETSRHGAGLGLAIAKGIVEAHGGQIGVTSHVGEGTCFYFTVPHQAPQQASRVND